MIMAETTRPTYGNWRLPTRPGIGPLGLLGTALLLGGLVAALLVALVSWIAALTLAGGVTAVIVPLAIRTPDGRSGLTALADRAGWTARKLTGTTTTLTGPLSRESQGRFRLPGLLKNVEMLEGRDAYGRRFGVLHDQQAGTYSIVLDCDPDGGALVDADQVDLWVACWGGFLAGLAHEPGLAGASVIVETAPDPGTRLAAEVLPRLHPNAPAVAKDLMKEIVAAYPAASSETATFVTLTYRQPHGSRLATRGDRSADMVMNLATRIPQLAASLVASGGGEVRPVAAERLADVTRAAYDPAAAPLILRASAEQGGTGQEWADAGPVTTQETADFYLHDGFVSRSWVACEAPRGSVRSKRAAGPAGALAADRAEAGRDLVPAAGRGVGGAHGRS
jgi:hypothetical protein